MQDSPVTDLLAADHAALSLKLECDPITGDVLALIARRSRRRMVAVTLAGAAGLAVAASQLAALGPMQPVVTLLRAGPSLSVLAGMLLIAATMVGLCWSLMDPE